MGCGKWRETIDVMAILSSVPDSPTSLKASLNDPLFTSAKSSSLLFQTLLACLSSDSPTIFCVKWRGKIKIKDKTSDIFQLFTNVFPAPKICGQP